MNSVVHVSHQIISINNILTTKSLVLTSWHFVFPRKVFMVQIPTSSNAQIIVIREQCRKKHMEKI